MFFRFSSNQFFNRFSQTTSAIAKSVGFLGLALVGFGMLIIAMPAIFVAIAAGIFIFAGVSCFMYALKLFFASRGMRNQGQGNSANGFRDNVRIHQQGQDTDYYE